MLFLILGLSLFDIFLAAIISLEKGVPYTTYQKGYFFIDASQNQVISGSVHINYKVSFYHPFNYFIIAETGGLETSSSYKTSKISIDFKQNETELSFNFSHMASDKRTYKLRFNFDIQMLSTYNFTITVDHVSNCFQLSNGITQNFTNLTAGLSYIFYIETTNTESHKNVNISLSMDSYPNSLYIYEYKSIDYLRSPSQYLKKSSYDISINKDEEDYKIFIPYVISLYDTKYVSFQIKSQYDIDYLFVKIDLGGAFKTIINNNYKYSNLIAGNNYDYYFEIKEKQLAKIFLTINSTENIPFEYINISEYTNNKNSINNFKVENVTDKYNKENDLYIVSIEYFSPFYNTSFLSLGILPKYNINNISIKREIGGGVIICSNSHEKRIDHKPGYPYYLYINAAYRQTIIFRLINYIALNDELTRGIKSISIYEYSYRNSSSHGCCLDKKVDNTISTMS